MGVTDKLDLAAAPDTEIDATIDVSISLTNVNERPTIDSGPTASNVPENTTVVATYTATDVDALDTLTWSAMEGDDHGFFEIDASGELSFTVAPDFETKEDQNTDNVYRVTVRVTDSGVMSATRDVAVTVTNVNEQPAIDGTANGATINKDENTATTDVLATYEASDADVSDTLTWSLQGADSGDFTITENATGQRELTFSNSPNFEMPADSHPPDNVYEVTVKVSDGLLTDMRTLMVVVDDVNEPPTIDSGPTASNVPENTTVVATYTATDVDALDTLTWSAIEGDDHGFFEINASGELSFTVAPDFETKEDQNTDNVYHVTVRVTDSRAP